MCFCEKLKFCAVLLSYSFISLLRQVRDSWLGHGFRRQGFLLGSGASFPIGSRKWRPPVRRVFEAGCWLEPSSLQETRDAGCFPEENISNCCDISFKWAAGGVRPSGEPECPFPVATAATPVGPAYQAPQPLCTTPRPWLGVGIHAISHPAQSPPPPSAL